MRTATRSFSLWRGLTPIHHEEECWWAESPDLPDLSVAEDSREALLAAIKPAVEYYIEETPGLQDRPMAWQITNEHVGPTDEQNEARTT